MENAITFEYIEQYLEGQLTQDEQERFEKQLETDTELQDRLEKHQQVHQSLKSYARAAVKEEVSTVYNRVKGGAKTVQFPTWTYSMAAAILVLCMLAVGYVWMRNQHSNPQLFTEQFKPHPLRTTVMGDQKPGEFILADFTEAYMAEDYETAIKEGEIYLTLPDSSRTAHADSVIYIGLANAYLSQNRAPQAIELLRLATENNPEDEVAKWYLGLAFLSDDQTPEARAIFEAILADPESSYMRSSAEKILQSLDSIWR